MASTLRAPTTCPRCLAALPAHEDTCATCGNEGHAGPLRFIAAALLLVLCIVAVALWQADVNRTNDRDAGDPYTQCIRTNGDDLICRTKR